MQFLHIHLAPESLNICFVKFVEFKHSTLPEVTLMDERLRIIASKIIKIYQLNFVNLMAQLGRVVLVLLRSGIALKKIKTILKMNSIMLLHE